MSMKFLRRRYRIILLIGIAGSLFLCFQLFSFQVINLSSRHEAGTQRKARILDDVDVHVDQVKRARKEEIAQNAEKHVGAVNGLAVEIKKEDETTKPEGYQLVRGTHLHQAEDYKEKNGMFQCIQSKELIPYSQVNDDYCDCEDSSDEPGTAACPKSVFFCAFQNSDEPPQHIPGSRVNDGVCDCCDGSDEWAGIQVFSGVQITDKRYQDTLKHTPCNNTCLASQQSRAEDAKIRQLGKRLKHTYLEAGKKVRETDLYGPEGVFYQLSLTCFDHETKEYKYKFCPFKSVTQQNFPSSPVHIGKKPRWKTKFGGVYVLSMEGGDASGCPGGKQRKTVITFICGLSDHIVEVREDEKCVYGIKFSTPAAC